MAKIRNADGTFAFQDTAQRFISKIVPLPSGCWHYEGPRGRAGYGSFSVGHKTYAAHRFAYQLANGVNPGKLLVCHRCDNPPCVNPAHLFLGTTQDNIADKLAKGRQRGAEGDRHGSKTHPERIARGTQLPQTQLDEDAIRQIRAMHERGMSQAAIGKLFGVCSSNIGKVVRGESWGWVK